MSTHQHYLRDLGDLLRRAANEAHEKAKTSKTDFDSGRGFAYYEVLSLMCEQAIAFNLPLSDLALDGLDPDRDLL
jgi:hypothetical protein